MKLLLALLLSAPLWAAPTEVAKEWDYGWKTSGITATRYSSQYMGFNIGFTVKSTWWHKADRAEVMDFIEASGGTVYQGGGFPGAETFVVFKAVKDRESANVFLKTFLPKFQSFMEKLK